MKSVLMLALVSISFSASAALKIGDVMPSPARETKMMSTKDVAVTIEQIAKEKKGTLVVFSCNHCPYAKAWDSRISAIGADAQTKGLGVVMINSNDPTEYPEDGMKGMKMKSYAFPYVVDSTSQIAKDFGATKTPDVFLFDAKGKLVYKGAVDDNSESNDKVKKHHLKDAIDAMLNKRKIVEAETVAVGCGIKFRK